MSRYTPDELERWLWVETIADPAEPTPTEISAGVNIRDDIASVSGFSFTVGTAETPDMSSRFTKTVAGRSSAEAGTLEFYMGDDATDSEAVIREALARGAEGYVVRVHPVEGAPAALSADTVVEVWPSEVMGNNVNAPAPGEPAKYTVTFSHPEPPEQFAVITV